MRNLILSELRQADRLKTRHIQGFAQDGVDLLDLAASAIRHDWVVPDGSRFEFARHIKGGSVARAAFIWPAWDSYGELADIVAWRPGRDLTTWLGGVAALGEEQILGPRLCDPLRVHADVLSWFRAKRQGIFIIDHTRAADLLRCETLGVADATHARALRAKLTGSAPPIVIVEEEAKAQVAHSVHAESEVAA